VHRVESEGHDGVDFLIDLLRADLGGEGSARAPGEHDGGHEGPELAQHGDPHAVYYEDHRAKLLRHQTDLEGDDHPHQKPDEQDDGDSIRARLGGYAPHLAPADDAAVSEGLAECRAAVAQECKHPFHISNLLGCGATDLLDDADWRPLLDVAREITGLIVGDQGSQVRGQAADFHFRPRRALPALEIENQCNARVVDVLQP